MMLLGMLHCNTTMGNDVARNIHCDITMDNDVAMCTYHRITMHNDIARNLFWYYYMPNYDIAVSQGNSLKLYTNH